MKTISVMSKVELTDFINEISSSYLGFKVSMPVKSFSHARLLQVAYRCAALRNLKYASNLFQDRKNEFLVAAATCWMGLTLPDDQWSKATKKDEALHTEAALIYVSSQRITIR